MSLFYYKIRISLLPRAHWQKGQTHAHASHGARNYGRSGTSVVRAAEGVMGRDTVVVVGRWRASCGMWRSRELCSTAVFVFHTIMFTYVYTYERERARAREREREKAREIETERDRGRA